MRYPRSSMTTTTRTLRIDAERLLRRIDELARCGPRDDGGVCRLALTDADREARDLVVGWMRALGLAVTVDRVGNVVGVRAGRTDGPPVMTGSHVDTVATGGRYDGNLGVLAGLEVVETLNDANVTTQHPLAVGFFTNEEGARFAPDMLGSLVYVGGLALDVALASVGIDGAVLGDELARIGYAGDAPVGSPDVRAFVELHVEQGPVLESEGVTIGAVHGVQGISWTEVSLTGQANHAGTTPMRLRRDPAVVAGRLAGFLRDLAGELGAEQLATCGAIDLVPNLINVIPARARATVDLRNTDGAVLREAERRVDAWLRDAAAAEGLELTTRTLARFDPVRFDSGACATVEDVARELGHSVRRITSGAGHDAQMLARVCPAAMIFVPSVGGISHNPKEHTEPADLAAGANVLLHVLLRLASR